MLTGLIYSKQYSASDQGLVCILGENYIPKFLTCTSNIISFQVFGHSKNHCNLPKI